MAGLIVFTIFVLIVMGLVLYAITLLPFIMSPIKELIMALIVLLAAFAIAARAGVIPMMISHSWIDYHWLDQARGILRSLGPV